tara:strand:- start:295 stop:459 length:165 start_codon:yes stop_codon:yes gene_type:complete
MSKEKWDKVIDINLNAIFLATKVGILGFTRALFKEGGKYGILLILKHQAILKRI